MDSSTPLILAATHGFTDVINLLASAGCDLDQRNSEGNICFSSEVTLRDLHYVVYTDGSKFVKVQK